MKCDICGQEYENILQDIVIQRDNSDGKIKCVNCAITEYEGVSND